LKLLLIRELLKSDYEASQHAVQPKLDIQPDTVALLCVLVYRITPDADLPFPKLLKN